MSKYDKFESQNKSDSKGPHPDYEYNLKVAKNFIDRVTPHLLPGMNIAIKGSHGLDNSLLMVSWNAPRHAKVGNWANGVFLHQSRDSFAKSMEWTFNDYLARAKKYNVIANNDAHS